MTHGRIRAGCRQSLGADVDPFILHLFAALAEKERAMIAARTHSLSSVQRLVAPRSRERLAPRGAACLSLLEGSPGSLR